MNKKLNPNLVSYIEKEIFPIYEAFDKGHDLNHIISVINRALSLANQFDDIEIDWLDQGGISIHKFPHQVE